MTAKGLKKFLDSFVEAQHQTFDVRFARDTKRGPLGTYLRKARLITVYPKKLRSRFELLGIGLHELAHHLTWECDADVYACAGAGGKKVRHHGKEFFRHLKALVTEFNRRYGEQVGGLMFCSSRAVSRSPGFVKFSELDRRTGPADPGFFVLPDKMPRYARDNTRKITRGRRIVLIGFNGRGEAFIYSKHTRKFEYKVPTSWKNLLCSYAAATPRSGELWEFGVVAKRVFDASGKRAG